MIIHAHIIWFRSLRENRSLCLISVTDMATKRKASAISGNNVENDPIDPSDELIFLGLGGCQEVGRSCHILQYKGKTVMVRDLEYINRQSC